MKSIPFVSFMFRPREVREVAKERAEIGAVIVNAMNGMFFVGAIALPMQSLFTISLVALQIIIFGPLVGFVVSSLYSRVEWTVGRRLGGNASLVELYCLFAWAMLPAGFAVFLYGLILLTLNEPSTTTEYIVSIPSLIIFCCSIRNYCSNIIASQQFSKTRGTVCVVLSFVLFLTLMAGGIGFLSLLFSYGMGECQQSIFPQQ
jgi:hypothetical protein